MTLHSEYLTNIMNERLTIEKETASFLRIGSLNVRVKKTTEAFNNLMTSAGIASGIASGIAAGSAKVQDRLNKPWGSVDNLQTSVPTVGSFIHSLNFLNNDLGFFSRDY